MKKNAIRFSIATLVLVSTPLITVTAEDGGHVDIACTLASQHCNMNTPGWGESLGFITVYTSERWTIEGNGISQVWSDAVSATNCQKVTFEGGSRGNFNADCRSNPDFPGDLFTWCAVVRFADQLCPYPWRVPTMQDFINLDIALGGSGNNRRVGTSDLATPEFVTSNYIYRWGGNFGGSSLSGGSFVLDDDVFGSNDSGIFGGRLLSQGSWGNYWSQSEGTDRSGRILEFSMNGNIRPQTSMSKSTGSVLRCVQ